MRNFLACGTVLALVAVTAAGCSSSSNKVFGGLVLFDLSLEDATGAPTGEFVEGQEVSFVLRIENDTAEATRLGFTSGCALDAQVFDDSGGEVWTYLRHTPCTDGLTSIDLEPGEIVFLEAAWDQTDDAGRAVPAGAYSMQGALATGFPSVPVGDEVSFTIVPGDQIGPPR